MPDLPFDIQRARRDTPACEQVLHFNNAGASLMPQPVVEAVIGHLQLEAKIGGYEAADRQQAQAERFYGAAAELIGARPDEIAFVDSATRAWNTAFLSIPFQPGDRIITARSEYASNVISLLHVAKRLDLTITVIPDDATGQVDLAALRAAIDDRTRLIALTQVPSTGGLVNPAAAVGRIAQQAGVLYLLDACQAVGQLDIDVEAIGCDMLAATGRKYLRGPRGTGFLYVRRAAMARLVPPTLDFGAAEWVRQDAYEMRADARRYETWEASIAGKIGLAVAMDYASAWGMPAIETRVTALADRLRAALSAIPGVTVQDRGRVRCGIVTFTLAGQEPLAIKAALANQGIHVSVAKVQASRYDLEPRGIEAMVRASVHYYNTEAEVARFCEVLAELRIEFAK
jgi:selenocysteine lyase/cysteine desulfurase